MNRSLRITRAMLALSFLLGGGLALGQQQVVTPNPGSIGAGAVSPVSLNVLYTTTPTDPTLTGLGLRMHFNSSQLAFSGLGSVLGTGLIAQSPPTADLANWDSDPETDMYVTVAWADISGAWPGSVPQLLYRANFVTSATFTGVTRVNFTASSTAAGYSLAASSATIQRVYSADLRISKTDGLQTVQPGENITYTVTVSNAGPGAASGALVQDLIPSQLAQVSWTCAANGGASCTATGTSNLADVVNLPVGGSLTYSIHARVNASGPILNTATVSVPAGVSDPVPGNNSSTDFTQALTPADLAISQTASPEIAIPGATLELRALISNSGPGAASNVVVSIRPPASASVEDVEISVPGACNGTTLVRCVVGSLPAGESATVTLTLSVDSLVSSSLLSTADVAGGYDPSPGNNSSLLAVPVATDVRMEVSQLGSDPVTVAQDMALAIRVDNPGMLALTGLTVRDELPDAFRVVSAEASQGSCTVIGREIECQLGTLPSSGQALVEVVAYSTRSGRFANTATATSMQTSPVESVDELRVASLMAAPATLNANDDPLMTDTFVGVAALNPLDEAVELAFTGLDALGGTVYEGALSTPMATDSQIAKLTTDLPLEDSSTLTAQGVPHPVQGFFMLGDLQVQRLDGVGGDLHESPTLFFPLVRQNATESTTLFLFNPSRDDTVVTLKLFGVDGHESAEVFRNLPSKGTLHGSLADFFGEGIVLAEGYARVTAQTPIQGFETVASPVSFACIGAQTGEGVLNLSIPHFFLDGEGGGTEVRLLNSGSRDALVSAVARGDDAELLGQAEFQIESGRLFVADLGDLFSINTDQLAVGETISGYALLEVRETSEDNEPGERPAHLSGGVTFHGNQGRFRSTLPLVSQGFRQTLLAHVAQSAADNIFTGLALLNNGSVDATVILRAFDEDGTLTAETQVAVPAGRRLVDLIDQPSFFGAGFEQKGGHILVLSDVPLQVFALFGGFDLEFMSAIEAQERLQEE